MTCLDIVVAGVIKETISAISWHCPCQHSIESTYPAFIEFNTIQVGRPVWPTKEEIMHTNVSLQTKVANISTNSNMC